MITTCTTCGKNYEAGSEEQANEPSRFCPTCWRDRHLDPRHRKMSSNRETTWPLQCEPLRLRCIGFEKSGDGTDCWKVLLRTVNARQTKFSFEGLSIERRDMFVVGEMYLWRTDCVPIAHQDPAKGGAA